MVHAAALTYQEDFHGKEKVYGSIP